MLKSPLRPHRQKPGLQFSLPSCTMADDKAKKLDIKEKEPAAKKAGAGGKVKKGTSRPKCQRRGAPLSQSLSWSEASADTPDSLPIPGRPRPRASTQQLNPGLQRKRKRFLQLSHNQLVVTRMVAPEWLNFPKRLDTILQKTCMARSPSVGVATCDWTSVPPSSAFTQNIPEVGHRHLHPNWYQGCENPQTSHRHLLPKRMLQKLRHHEGAMFHSEKQTRHERAAQGRPESPGLAPSAPNPSCFSVPGLPLLLVCAHKWALFS